MCKECNDKKENLPEFTVDADELYSINFYKIEKRAYKKEQL